MRNKFERVQCESMFSNGTEYEYFLETQCFRCKRFRNGRCFIYNAIEDARWEGEKVFPFDELLEWDGGLAGKACKRFTEVPIRRKRKPKKPVEGQTELDIWKDVG